jgi:hypothetical protein
LKILQQPQQVVVVVNLYVQVAQVEVAEQLQLNLPADLAGDPLDDLLEEDPVDGQNSKNVFILLKIMCQN